MTEIKGCGRTMNYELDYHLIRKTWGGVFFYSYFFRINDRAITGFSKLYSTKRRMMSVARKQLKLFEKGCSL